VSIIVLAALIGLTIAQLLFWEHLGETFGYAASVSVVGLSASLSMIAAAYVVVTHVWGTSGKSS
jgi:hypothetical protein